MLFGNNGSNSIIPAHRQAISKRNWLYTVKHLNCSICSMRSINDSHNVEMLLTFERNQRRLHLQIYSPEGLLGLGQESFVYCFTDASKELKKRVRVEQKFHYGKENDNKERTYSIYKVKLETYIGQYWCEAHKRSLIDELIQSNTVIAYKKKEGNEYSLRISVNNFCRHFNCKIPNTIPYDAFVNSLENTIFKNINAELRVMKIFSYDIYKLDVLIHISTEERKDIVKEYGHIKEELKKLPEDVKVDYLESSEFCLPEVTQLDYISLNWPLTSIETSVVPEEICLENNNLPIYRVCHGNFLYGAKWSKVHGNCQSQKNVSESTKFFQSAVNQNVSEQLIKNVTEVIGNNTDLSVLSIYYLEKILKHVSEISQNDSTLINCTIDMTSNLLNVQSKSLVEAQTCFNATDTILDAIEEILANPKFDWDVHLIKRRNIIVHVTNPFLSNVSGVVVSSTADGDLQVDDFKRDDNFENVSINPHLKVAVYVPEAILEDIYEQNITNVYIVTTIYLNDRLFVSSSKEPAGPIVSVTIPHYGDYLPSSLPIIFKTDVTYKIVPECGFWDYGKNTRRKKGDWSKMGANYLGNINNDSSVHSCSFSHLTHFALLILDQDLSKDILDKNDDDFLTVITITGGSLTIIGITCIFITAIVFEKWRRKQGTKILINLSIAILLEALTMHLTEIKGLVSSDLSCQIIGSITHYIVVSKFCWMLVYAFLQYMRFVKVLGILPENVVIKSAVFGWGFAIIPVVVVNLSNPYTYSLKNYHFCYPRGMSLYLGVLLPVVSIILINLVVFYVVMNHVSTKKDRISL
ncbi:hypothetical protein NQ318_007893 [Aromia moschata]|uniref:Uncharacterized protein n=1 Tax=Aromia moschata TaxID=1265417 RepID=A0AAV8XRC8_9CUCU|nr:hypothetical protein NQ318_007893 [Aromia moschata]